ncbi:MAG: hypothetical protein ACK4WC_11825 [Rubrimonas sp.]
MMVLRWILAAALALTAFAAAAQAQLGGGYFGLDEADGMRLRVERSGGGVRGSIDLGDGTARSFDAQPVGDGAVEAMIPTPEGQLLIRIFPEPIGARVVLAPVADGVLDAGRLMSLAFLRDGVALPEMPTRFLPAPAGPVRAFDGAAFVDSYAFWEPLGAAFAYDALEPRMRTIIRLFPTVQTDVLWRLCRSPERTAGLAEALRGQGVGCQEVVSAVRAMQTGPAFDRFKRDVATERALLMTAISCADDLRRQRPECQRAAGETARRAVSMETAATVLARYR